MNLTIKREQNYASPAYFMKAGETLTFLKVYEIEGVALYDKIFLSSNYHSYAGCVRLTESDLNDCVESSEKDFSEAFDVLVEKMTRDINRHITKDEEMVMFKKTLVSSSSERRN